MQTSMTQRSGSSSRTFTLRPDGLDVEAADKYLQTAKHYTFEQFGAQKADYDIAQKRLQRFTHLQTTLSMIACFLIATAFFSISSQAGQSGNNLSPLGIVTVCLGWLFVIAAFAMLIVRTKPIRCKRVYFAGGSLEFFFRNQQDSDQIDGFLAAYAEAESRFERELFLTRLKQDPSGMERWLDDLTARGVFTAQEQATHYKAIRSVKQSRAKRS